MLQKSSRPCENWLRRSVGLAPALVLRQTPSAHDQVNFLPQNASPAVGFRLGALKRVDNGLLVVGDEGDQARRRLTAESTPIRLTARRALRRLRAAPEKNTEALASIAIRRAGAASRPRALTSRLARPKRFVAPASTGGS